MDGKELADLIYERAGTHGLLWECLMSMFNFLIRKDDKIERQLKNAIEYAFMDWDV